MKIVEYSFYMESCYIMTCHQTKTKLPGGKSSSCNRVEFSQPIQLPKKKLKESD